MTTFGSNLFPSLSFIFESIVFPLGRVVIPFEEATVENSRKLLGLCLSE